MQADKLYWGGFDRLGDDYAPILGYARENNHIRYADFDAHTVGRVNLFALRENFDFAALEEALDRITKTLPAIKRIFAKPIIRLKDASEIMPVESVRVVNNTTIVHASVHSELWDNITEEGLRPKKLLTLKHEDTYSIYENIAFARAVDIILQLVRRNIRLLSDILYANREMKFNLLERENHIAYFLAIGKLHIGYVRNYDQTLEVADRCLNKLLFIDRVVRSRLNSPVYQKCRRRHEQLPLKKTNIFRNHKDYHRVYLLLKWFADEKIGEAEAGQNAEAGSGEGYAVYCSLLTLFAAGHFNFAFRTDSTIDFFHMDVEARFAEWNLRLETVSVGEQSGIRMTFSKDVSYSILLLPATDGGQSREVPLGFRARYAADEYLIAAPYEGSGIYLSLYDIESFRRIQQILLRGMIAADRRRTVCPFCGRVPVYKEREEAYECASCRTQILERTCPETGRIYTATRIAHYRPNLPEQTDTARRDKLLYGRLVESQLRFRNITPLGDDGEIICPQCGKQHDDLNAYH